MDSSYRVLAGKSARDQLAALHIKYRQKRSPHAVAAADYKITKALAANPQGGRPIARTKFWTVTVRPLQAKYEIVGQEVRILRYDEAP